MGLMLNKDSWGVEFLFLFLRPTDSLCERICLDDIYCTDIDLLNINCGIEIDFAVQIIQNIDSAEFTLSSICLHFIVFST